MGFHAAPEENKAPHLSHFGASDWSGLLQLGQRARTERCSSAPATGTGFHAAPEENNAPHLSQFGASESTGLSQLGQRARTEPPLETVAFQQPPRVATRDQP